MSASRPFVLDVPASTAAGAALDVSRFRRFTLQAQQPGAVWASSMQLQGRLRGGPWENIGTAITFAELGDLIAIDETLNVEELRVNNTYTSGPAPTLRLHTDRDPD